MNQAQAKLPIYDLSINACVSWQAHSLSNAGTNGSNRMMPRRQLLADGSETDACSGSIAKHYHAVLLAEYLAFSGVPLCPACQRRDGRRVAALTDRPEYENISMEHILAGCGLCDAHGFLVTAKKANAQQGTETRKKATKHSLVEFSFALGLPKRSAETVHLFTRIGDSKDEGQMLMKRPTRSGDYALSIRYRAVGTGVDTDKWQIVIADATQRRTRHAAILWALHDTLLSPEGALTATMLPHLTGLQGAIVVKKTVGRAPMYSGLVEDFVDRLHAMQTADCAVYSFDTVDSFSGIMQQLVTTSFPSFPAGQAKSEHQQEAQG